MQIIQFEILATLVGFGIITIIFCLCLYFSDIKNIVFIIFSKEKDKILKLKQYKLYVEWKDRIGDKTICDFDRGCGYFGITTGWYGDGKSILNREDWIEFNGGIKMLCRVVDYEFHRDPHDMFKHLFYQILQVEDERPLSKMTFAEFLDSKLSNFR